MLDPLQRVITVPCSQKNAFDIFLTGMDGWWPKAKFTVAAMAGAPAPLIRVEPRVGGTITEVGADGSEVVWGIITTYDPHGLLAMDFHMPRPGDVVTGRPKLELRFDPLSPAETRVTLTQSNWEALGDWAAPSQGGYAYAWTPIFEAAYAGACQV